MCLAAVLYDVDVLCVVNPNIKLVREYNYSGGFWLSLSSSFSAHRAFEAKLAILLPQKASLR